jgi:CrcB protein
MARFLTICLAGAVGTGCRYLLSGWVPRFTGPAFPWGTLVVNVIGSFLLGLLMQLALSTELVDPDLRVVLGVGFLGGFTTYSSFNYETLRLLEERSWAFAAGNVAGTLAGCLLAGFAGVALARRVAGL